MTKATSGAAAEWLPLIYGSADQNLPDIEQDIGERLLSLLDRYQCTPDSHGWRELAIMLAVRHGEPEFEQIEIEGEQVHWPSHQEVRENRFQLINHLLQDRPELRGVVAYGAKAAVPILRSDRDAELEMVREAITSARVERGRIIKKLHAATTALERLEARAEHLFQMPISGVSLAVRHSETSRGKREEPDPTLSELRDNGRVRSGALDAHLWPFAHWENLLRLIHRVSGKLLSTEPPADSG